MKSDASASAKDTVLLREVPALYLYHWGRVAAAVVHWDNTKCDVGSYGWISDGGYFL